MASPLLWDIPVINIKDIECEQASDLISSGTAFIVSDSMSVAPWKNCEPLASLTYFYEMKDKTPLTPGTYDNSHNIEENSEKNHFNIHHLDTEILVQQQDMIQESVMDFPIEMDTAQAIRLLHFRCYYNEKVLQNEKSEADDSHTQKGEILYKHKQTNDTTPNSISNSKDTALGELLYTDDNIPHAFSTLLDKKGLVLYVKIPLNGCSELLQHMNLPSFLQRATPIVKYEPVSHPMLLRPCTYFCWVYIGEKGTGSRTHVDVMASDAWLVVLSGLKEWAMVHPMDKHLVMDEEGKFADLFNIDYKRFPYAYKARLSTFIQRTGDAVFVPSNAPHCVRNLTFSISVTYNFCPPETKLRWASMMNKMVQPAAPTYATVDVMLYCLNTVGQRADIEIKKPVERFKRTYIRAYVDHLPVLPTTDFDARKWLEPIHIAFRPFCRILEAGKVAGVPIGYDICQHDHRILYYYEILSEDWFMELFGRKPFTIEEQDSGNYSGDVDNEKEGKKDSYRFLGQYLTPQHSFSHFYSHFGAIPDFLPLRALLGFPIMAKNLLKTVSVLGHVFDNDKSDKEGSEGGKYLWHYSRFPWKVKKVNAEAEHDTATINAIEPQRATPWCATFLFYSSPDIHGPVSLHPLLTDPTLQSSAMLQQQKERISDPTIESHPIGNPVDFDPHFELFKYSSHSLHPTPSDSSAPLQIYDLTSDMIRVLTINVVFGGGEVADQLLQIIQVGRDHGLHIVNPLTSKDENYSNVNKETRDMSSKLVRSDGGILDIGLEKIMVLVLWFSCHAKVVGFTYHHTFSTVEEPATLCLTGSAASRLLSRIEDSTVAQNLSKLCNLIDPPTSEIDVNKRQAIREAVEAVRRDFSFHEVLLPLLMEQKKDDIISRIIEIKSNAIALCSDDTDVDQEIQEDTRNAKAWKEIITIITD